LQRYGVKEATGKEFLLPEELSSMFFPRWQFLLRNQKYR
jgi:hypothetical protein